jgi:hypothetical protein
VNPSWQVLVHTNSRMIKTFVRKKYTFFICRSDIELLTERVKLLGFTMKL